MNPDYPSLAAKCGGWISTKAASTQALSCRRDIRLIWYGDLQNIIHVGSFHNYWTYRIHEAVLETPVAQTSLATKCGGWISTKAASTQALSCRRDIRLIWYRDLQNIIHVGSFHNYWTYRIHEAVLETPITSSHNQRAGHIEKLITRCKRK